MHRLNIDKIMESSLWKKIKRNENFLDYKIVTTNKGHWFMAIYFGCEIKQATMSRYLREAAKICCAKDNGKYGGCEYLDGMRHIAFYGVKQLVFS